MPPLPIWLDGAAMVGRFLAERIFATPWRAVPTASTASSRSSRTRANRTGRSPWAA